MIQCFRGRNRSAGVVGGGGDVVSVDNVGDVLVDDAGVAVADPGVIVVAAVVVATIIVLVNGIPLNFPYEF